MRGFIMEKVVKAQNIKELDWANWIMDGSDELSDKEREIIKELIDIKKQHFLDQGHHVIK